MTAYTDWLIGSIQKGILSRCLHIRPIRWLIRFVYVVFRRVNPCGKPQINSENRRIISALYRNEEKGKNLPLFSAPFPFFTTFSFDCHCCHFSSTYRPPDLAVSSYVFRLTPSLRGVFAVADGRAVKRRPASHPKASRNEPDQLGSSPRI